MQTLLRILTPAMALFLLAGCSLLPSEPEVMVAEPELVASNLQIELVEVSQTMNAPDFYRELNQPGWAPPGWLFGPVWTTLYTFMGIAA